MKKDIFADWDEKPIKITRMPIYREGSFILYAVGINESEMGLDPRELIIYESKLNDLSERGVYPNPVLCSYSSEDAWSYNSNNGVMCIVTDREVYLAPYNPIKEAYLEEIGLRRNPNLFVPCSNGEKPLDDLLREEFERIVEKRQKELLRELELYKILEEKDLDKI